MAEDDHVGLEGLNVLGGVAEGFALGRAAAGAVEGNDVGAQPLGGHVKGHPRAGAGFEEEIDDGFAAQGGDFFHAAREGAFEGNRRRVDLVDLGEGKFLEGNEVFARPGHERREGMTKVSELIVPDCGRRLDADGVAVGGVGVKGDDDFFVSGRGEGEAGVVGGDGHEATAAVNEDGEFDFGGATVVEEFVEGSFHGATGEEDVVNEDDGGPVDVSGDVRRGKFLGDGVAADVVAVEGDVDGARRGGELRVERCESRSEPLGEGDAAVGDAEEQEFFGGAVTGGNGGRELRDGSVYFLGADSLNGGHEAQLRRVERGVGRLFCGDHTRNQPRIEKENLPS